MMLTEWSPAYADERLADAIWWFRGFDAARAVSCPMASGEASSQDLSISLARVREWLGRLAEGRARLLGTGDRHLGCAITEGELEVLLDGLRETASREDVQAASKLIGEVFAQFRNESASSRGLAEVAF